MITPYDVELQEKKLFGPVYPVNKSVEKLSSIGKESRMVIRNHGGDRASAEQSPEACRFMEDIERRAMERHDVVTDVARNSIAPGGLHADDVIAAIDEMYFAGDTSRQWTR